MPEQTRIERFRAGYLRRAPRLLAVVSALIGILMIVEAVRPHERARIHNFTGIVPVPASAAATAVIAIAGLLLLRVAAGLRKRKRRAWRAALGITVVATLAHLVRDDRHLVAASITGLLALLLFASRSRFTARSDSYSRWFALRVFMQFAAFDIALGVIMTYATRGRVGVVGHPSVGMRLKEVVYGMVGANGPVDFHGERFDDIFHGTVFGIALTTVVVVVLLALRPPEPIARLSDDDEKRLRELLDKQGGRDSLGYFALRRDKSVVWSPTGKAAITYRVVQGVALVSGDPIGDPEAWPGAIAAYRQLVDEYAWTPAVMGCSELGATVFKREYDLSTLALGDEAILDVADFTLDGRPMRGVRQACTRVQRAGYDIRVRRACEISSEEFAELKRQAEAWRGDAVERGFSMALSRMGDPSDPKCVIATACHEGTTAGILHFVPWGCDGLSLDLMRRAHNADNGLNEFMIAELVRRCPEMGIKRVSLNFAVFRDAIERGERLGAGPILRAWRWVLVFVSRWWQIESLYRFNVKFRPYWEPRFISFPSTRDIPRIAVAALEAEAFIVRPHRLKRMLGRG